MNINIKDLHVYLEVKNRGVEFEIKDTHGKHLGDLIINKKGLIWCKGKTKSINGIPISWKEFIDLMSSGFGQ